MNKFIFKYGLIFLLIFTLTQCDYRTPSKKRFSNTLDIEIPKDAEILKDDYQSNWQDFSIEYKIKLTEELMKELTKSIRNSKFYNSNAVVKDFVTQEMFIESNDFKAVWAKTENGYVFQNEFDRDAYSAIIDTVNLVAKFNESHD